MVAFGKHFLLKISLFYPAAYLFIEGKRQINIPVFVAMHTGVVWLTIIPRVHVGSEMVDNQRGV